MDKALLEHLCALSKLGMDEEDQAPVLEQMSEIIALMDTIRDVETNELKPSEGLNLDQLREDIAKPSLTPEDALQNATDVRDGCFTVPKIME